LDRLELDLAGGIFEKKGAQSHGPSMKKIEGQEDEGRTWGGGGVKRY
jgi:hypothetical protein